MFEGHIKSTDIAALNNPLRNLAFKLKELLINLQNLDNFGKSNQNNIKLFFNESGHINISYNFKGHTLFSFWLEQNHGQYIFNKSIIFDVILSVSYSNRVDIISRNEELFESITETLCKYVVDGFELRDSYIRYSFPLDEIDNIIAKIKEEFEIRLEEFEIRLNTSKFNL